MDGLENFGLTMAGGVSSTDTKWTDLGHALGVQDPHVADARAFASRLSSISTSGAATFGSTLEDLAGPGDVIAQRMSEVLTIAGAAGTQPPFQKLEVGDRKRAAQSAARALSPQALVIMTQAVAQTFSLPLSQPLLELVQKLAREADTLPGDSRFMADQAFRSLVDHLVERWSESQVNAGASGFAEMFAQDTRARSTIAPEASRVVALSLESGAIGTVVWASLKEQSRSEKGVRDLIDMITKAPAGRATDMIREQIVSPGRLSLLLREDTIDFEAVDMMVQELGGNATKPLLDELVEATNRATRRSIMDRLVKIGPDIAPLVQERLGDNRWYVVRNMIALLRECGCQIDHAQLERFNSHTDARVRREMMQLRMEDPATRETALSTALLDKDKTVLRAALQAARSNLPSGAVAGLARRVQESDFPPEFRVMSLFLLGRSGNVAALDALLAYAGGGKSLLGKTKLGAKSPEMLAALSGLARSWSSERRARELIELAGKSKDEQILNALQAVGSGD